MPNDASKPVTVKGTDDARAGVTGHHVRTVLVVGLIGAILLMIGIAAITLH